MIRNVLTIFENETDVERLFNQKRDITYYRRARLNAKTIQTLMMIRMHADRNEQLIILSIDSILITESDTLNCDDMKKRANNQKNVAIYVSAEHDQFFEVFADDQSEENSDKKTNLNENFYNVINDEKFDREVNNLIDQTCTQQERVFVMNENEKRRREHQLSIDVLSSKRRI